MRLFQMVVSVSLIFMTPTYGADLFRPEAIPAKVEGCNVAKPGEYKVKVGDVFETRYTFPVVPSAFPKKVTLGVVQVTADGSESITTESEYVKIHGPFNVQRPNVVGGGELVFLCFVTEECASDVRLRLTVDANDYEYSIKVEPPNLN